MAAAIRGRGRCRRGVLGAVWGLTGATSPVQTSTVQTFELRGSLTLVGTTACESPGLGYSDIAEGASVTVYDADDAKSGRVALTLGQ